MNLRSVLFTGITVAAFAYALAFDGQAQTSVAAPSAQESPTAPDGAQPDASAAMVPRNAKHHRAHRMPTGASTPAEKAATDRLNAQQLDDLAASAGQTSTPQPSVIDSGSKHGPTNSETMPSTPDPQPVPSPDADPPNQPAAGSPPQ